MKNKYTNAIDSIVPSDETVDRAIYNIINNQTSVTYKKNNNYKKYLSIGAIAASIIIIIGFISIFNINFDNKKNSFVLKANAAENSIVNKNYFVTIGKCKIDEAGVMADEDMKLFYVINHFNFPIKCEGNNIKKIKYSVNNAVFSLKNRKVNKKNLYFDTIYVSGDKQTITSYSINYNNQKYIESNDVYLYSSISDANHNLSPKIKKHLINYYQFISRKNTTWTNSKKELKLIYNEFFKNIQLNIKVYYTNDEIDSKDIKLRLNKIVDNEIYIGAELK